MSWTFGGGRQRMKSAETAVSWWLAFTFYSSYKDFSLRFINGLSGCVIQLGTRSRVGTVRRKVWFHSSLACGENASGNRVKLRSLWKQYKPNLMDRSLSLKLRYLRSAGSSLGGNGKNAEGKMVIRTLYALTWRDNYVLCKFLAGHLRNRADNNGENEREPWKAKTDCLMLECQLKLQQTFRPHACKN